MSSHRPEADRNSDRATTAQISPEQLVPAQRATEQAPVGPELIAQREPAAAVVPAVAASRWTAARVACLPLAALCFYLGTMTVLAALDRVISPIATGAAMSGTLAVIAFAVGGVALIGGGVRAMQVALHR